MTNVSELLDTLSQDQLVRNVNKLSCINFKRISALKEFEEAAEDFMGEIEFFAVVTSKVSVESIFFQKCIMKKYNRC